MTNTYLLEVIKALHPEELQDFAQYLHVSFPKKGENVKKLDNLLHVIMEAAPNFSDEKLEKEKVYWRVFKERNMVEGKLEKLMADLNKLLRTYALTNRYFSDHFEAQQQLDWAAWLRERGLADRSKLVLSKLKITEERKEAESLERFRLQMLIAEEEHLWEAMFNKVKSPLNIPGLIHQLDLYYHNYRMDRVNRYVLQQKGAQLPDVDFSDVGIESHQQESLLLRIAMKVFTLLKKEALLPDDIQELMDLLQANETKLSHDALDHFYAYLRNACTLLINGGNLDFIPILHKINQDNLERGYFMLHSKISPHVYLNLVSIAIRAKDVEWAKTVTTRFKDEIIEGDEDQFYYYLNLAQCFFAEGKYEEALKYIPDAPSSVHYHHLVRRLELKIYYEQESDLLLYKLDAFRKYIVRTAPKSIAADLREMDLNFLNILLQLSQSPPKDKARSVRLVERIKSKKLVADRTWLLEKAEALG